MECGTPLAPACPSCGRELPASARFCDGCGAPPNEAAAAPHAHDAPAYAPPPHLAAKILRERGTIEGERRTVTVLFIDAVGSTSAGERFDPEELHRIVHTATDRMIEAVNRFEGTVTQFRGDGIMAVFGAPIAHEDNARRAIAAALAMREALNAYAEEVGARAFAYRIGLNTGPVIVGSIGSDLIMDYTAIGDTVNLAARMEQWATPGAIYITEHTRRHVAGYFELRDLGPLEVKGKAEMVNVYEVLSERAARTRLDASADRGLTPYVGRSEHLEVLRRHFDLATRGQGQVVLVTGEAGMGKSRLLLEFRRSLAEEAFWLEGRCISWGRNFPYLPIVDIVRHNFGVEEGDADAKITAAIDARAQGWDAAAAGSAVPQLKYLVNIDPGDGSQGMDPLERRGRVLDALRALLVQESRSTPLVVAVEDLHWADEQSEDALAALVDAVASSPVLLILTHRPGYVHAFGDRTYYARMVLGNLGTAESVSMVQGVLQAAGVPERLQQMIVAKAEGNPFFIEEVSRSLVESGVLRRGAEGYTLARPVEQVSIPDTIQEVILSRLDRLQRNAKEAVQYASVIGREFPVRLLKHIAAAEQGMDALLIELKSLELIYEKSYFPELEYMFKHALTQEVALSTLLVDRRRALHRLVAAAIEELYADRLMEQHEALAYHYFEGEEWEKACEYARQVARRAASLHAPRATIDHASRAIEAALHCDAECCAELLEPDLYRLRGQAYEAIGEFDLSRADHESAMSAARERGDGEAEWQAHADLGMLWAGRDYDRTGEYCQQGYELARRLGDECLIAHSLNRLGNWHLNIERPIEALQHHEEALAIFERLDDRRGVAETLDFLCMGNALAGDVEAAWRRGNAAVELYREMDQRQGLSSVLATLALSGPALESTSLTPMTGDLTALRAISEESLSIAREIGWRAGESFALWSGATLDGAAGDFGRALVQGREALRIASAIGHAQWQTSGRWFVGTIYHWLFDDDAALRELTPAIEMAQGINSGHWKHTCAAAIARSYVAQGRLDEARAILAEYDDSVDTPRSYAVRELWMTRVQLQLAAGEYEGVLRTIDVLHASARGLSGREMSPALRWLRAQAQLALGRIDAAEGDLQRALELARTFSLRPLLWQMLATVAEHRRAHGREPEARAAFEEALRIVKEIAASLDGVDAQLKAHFLDAKPVRALRESIGAF